MPLDESAAMPASVAVLRNQANKLPSPTAAQLGHSRNNHLRGKDRHT